jgi:membrane peptidoglycan carboxypeptidase
MMNQVLRGVVNGRDGTAHLARVADFIVAGKTGTAQMVNPATRTYFRDRLVASFIGFVPAEDPKLVILVVLYDVPRGHFGGLVAAPVFSEIASDALARMAVAPGYPSVEANLLPIGNALGFFSSPENEDSRSNLPGVNDQVPSGLTQHYSAESATSGSRENGLSIPDFRGLSLRSALVLARTYQLALEVKGEGYVVSQEPKPGVPEVPDRLSNTDEPKGVQIVLAAPDQRAPDHLSPLEGHSARAAAPPIPAKAFSLAAEPSQYGRVKLVARSLPMRRAHGRRRCRDTQVVGARCVAR